MSEACNNCPIARDDPDAPMLNAGAARFANMPRAHTGWTHTLGDERDLPENRLYDATIGGGYDDALESLGISEDKMVLARRCAELINWNFCDFHAANYDQNL